MPERTIDSTRARLLVATLEGAGWSHRAIAAAAGIAPRTVNLLADGRAVVTPTIERALLAVDPGQLPTDTMGVRQNPMVPRIGTNRRIQALLALGWPHRTISEHAGLRTKTLLHQPGRWVTRATHDRVAAAYRTLSRGSGPSAVTARRAAARGYVGPMAWDDIDHDDVPDVEPSAASTT